MKVNIITIFPGFFVSPLETSLVGRAQTAGIVDVAVVDLRQYGVGPHRQVDGAPFGGGPGMVMMTGPLDTALGPLGDTRRILLTPSGVPLTQGHLDLWSLERAITLVCGRYEGIDERVAEAHIDESISLGDYVLMGGEVGALAIIEGVVRLLSGGVGNPASTTFESFRDGLLEEPQYTRPVEFKGRRVPDVLTSGDHAKVAQWRLKQRQLRTKKMRPDLWNRYTQGG